MEDTTTTVIAEDGPALPTDPGAEVTVVFSYTTTYRADSLTVDTIHKMVSQAAMDEGTEVVEPDEGPYDNYSDPTEYVDALLEAQAPGVTRLVLALLRDNADIEDEDHSVEEVS